VASFVKLYLSNRTAPYTPGTLRGAWDDTAGAVTRTLEAEKLPGGGVHATVARAETNASANFEVLLYRGVSGPLAAQTITGTIDVLIGMQESSTSADFVWHIHVYVTQGDSDTPRGTLLTDFVDTGNEFTTSTTGRALASAQALSSLAISAGDRLVVEIGYTALNAVTTSFTGTLRYGYLNSSVDALPDVTLGGAATNTASFITFSNAIDEATSLIAVRESQAVTEYIRHNTAAPVRVTQSVLEYVLGVLPPVRVTQTELENVSVVEVEPVPPPPVDVSALAAIEMCFGGSYRSWLRRR
jgi:hypothetical protein